MDAFVFQPKEQLHTDSSHFPTRRTCSLNWTQINTPFYAIEFRTPHRFHEIESALLLLRKTSNVKFNFHINHVWPQILQCFAEFQIELLFNWMQIGKPWTDVLLPKLNTLCTLFSWNFWNVCSISAFNDENWTLIIRS